MNTQIEETIYEWVWKRPARALKVFFKGSRTAAIHEKCIDCVGSAQEAKLCVCTDCPLWCFRPGATKGEVPAWVPSQAELEEMAEGRVSPAVREHARKMGLERGRGNS